MAGFSFLSRSDREQIDQTTEMSGETKRDVEQMVPGGFADFPAKLTAYDSSSGYYSWTRRAFDSSRARYDHPATVQVGTPTSNPARFPNGDVVDVSTPVDVWLRPVGIRTTVGMVHEVISSGSGSDGGVGVPLVYDYSLVVGFGPIPPPILTGTLVGVGTGLYQVILSFEVAGVGGTLVTPQPFIWRMTGLGASPGTLYPSPPATIILSAGSTSNLGTYYTHTSTVRFEYTFYVDYAGTLAVNFYFGVAPDISTGTTGSVVGTITCLKLR